MKKFLSVIILALLTTSLTIGSAFSQTDEEIISKKRARSETGIDIEKYVIGPEDILYIHVWREDALSRTVLVRMDGFISLPLINEIKASGLTPLQLKEELTKRFKEFIENPTVSVIVMEANSFKVYVSGQVRNPGVYRIRSEMTLLQIIPMAGGFTEWANQKKILIIRKEGGREKRFIVNYKKLIEGDELESNIILKAGDTVIVP